MRNIILIIILLVLIIIYLYKRRDHFEQFTLIGDHKQTEPQQTPTDSTLIHDKWKPLTINNQYPIVFNQNWNKVWKAPSASDKATTVQDIPPTDGHGTPPTKTLVNMFTGNQIKTTLKQMITSSSSTTSNQKFTSIIVDPTKIEKMNKKSWVDRIHLYNPESSNNIYPTPHYPIPVINRILADYLALFNEQVKSLYPDFINKFGYTPFQIFKYKLVNIEETTSNKTPTDKTRRYSIILVILRDVNASRAFTIYLQYLVNTDGQITLQNYDLIGIYYTDQLLMVKGEGPDYSQDDLLKVYKPITPDDAQYILDQEIKGLKQFKLTNQYSCFNKNPNDPSNTIIMANDKHNCEDKYDFFGREKPYGYWDKPCKSDNECPYNGGNKNYANSFGKCNKKGYCELPIGIKPLGYHHYFSTPDSKPLCYNCKSKSWKATTTLDHCCDKQKDKSIYPFLDGPDYAFKDDIFDRVNAYFKKTGCYTKHKYKNILTNELDGYEVICPKNK